MDSIQERISYIEGLAEGSDFYQNSKEGKIFSEIIRVLTDLNDSLQHTTSRLTELEDYVEAIDEDLNDIEWDFYEDIDDDYLNDEENDEETITEEKNFYQVECPSCHETVMIDQDLLGEDQVAEIVCPNCNEVIIIDDDHLHMEEQYQN